MDLDETMRQMEMDRDTTKVAEAPSKEAVASKLTAALEKAAGAPVPVPAQEVDAVDDLFKIAEQIAGTEKEAEVAHMAICGSAFADAAITKFAAYKLESDQLIAKTAAPLAPVQAIPGNAVTNDELKEAAEYGYRIGQQDAMAKTAQPVSEDDAFEKVSEDELVKIASDLGYQHTLEKIAAEYKEGHDAALQEVHDTASMEFLKGAAEASIIVDSLRQQQGQ